MTREQQKNYDYCASLWCAVNGAECEDEIIPERILAAVDKLTEREKIVLEARFRDCKTLRSTSVLLGVNPERVRQIEAKALRKLRHPSRKAWLTLEQLEAQLKLERERNDRLTERVAEFGAVVVKGEVVPKTECDKDLFELDFSARTYNSLKKSGVNTLGELLKKSEFEVRRMVNLGEKSFKEIQSFLNKKGLSLVK